MKGRGEIHLWTWTLSALPGDSALLSPDERVRAERYRLDRDRDRFVAGRAGLRRILASEIGADPAALLFAYSKGGKPSLIGGPHFSLSHSQDLAALAVSPDRPLGLDIERVRQIDEDIAGRFFAADEAARLRAVPEHDRTAAFFACWTRKEAYLKATGDGLLAPLDGFSVSLDLPPRLLRVEGDPAAAARWRFLHLDPAPGFVGAIATRAPESRLVLRRG